MKIEETIVYVLASSGYGMNVIGYIGESTRSQIEYALKNSMEVTCPEPQQNKF